MKKHRKDYSSSFVAISRETLFKNRSWRDLSLRAKVFYLYLKAKYNGKNNGKILLHYSELKDIPGFASKTGFYSAKKELIKHDWIKISDQGGLCRNSNSYSLTKTQDKMV